MTYVIKQDREKCIGCGACAVACPDNWEMKADGKSAPKKKEVEELGCNQEAADICPVQCIQVEEK